VIRESREEDVPVLERHLPTGANRYHEGRFHRQTTGLSTFLIAYVGEVPVGAGEVLWQGPKEADVRDLFPDCPEINGLAVVAERRSHGIGTAIVRMAEQLAAGRGCHRIGLGVDDHNGRAAALYERLGYEDIGCRYLDRYHYLGDDGTRREVADPCRFLIKNF
jgi:ribosomal protein S18 acetylase RimI-like enzyme